MESDDSGDEESGNDSRDEGFDDKDLLLDSGPLPIVQRDLEDLNM